MINPIITDYQKKFESLQYNAMLDIKGNLALLEETQERNCVSN